MEIERKYLIKPDSIDYTRFPCRIIEQGYLSKEPVVRVRRDNDDYYLTYKSKGLMVREEANLPLNKESYLHLLKKSDGAIIRKCRYLIPYTYVPSDGITAQCTIELDVFEGDLAPLILAEVEFPSIEEANRFVAPDWFAQEVTQDPHYQNSNLTGGGSPRTV